MAKFNYREMAKSVARSEIGRKRVNTVAQNRFQAAKLAMLQEFENDEVTKEIAAGTEAKNLSQTLNGYSYDGKEGNLFTFIGFDEGSDPIEPLREVLRNDVDLGKSSRGTVSGQNKITYKWSLKIPSQAIRDATPLPFEKGQSWADGIENGISGFGSYMRGVFKGSKSGGGLQASVNIRGGVFTARDYLSKLFRNLVERF